MGKSHKMKVLLIENDEDVRCVASLSLSLIGGLEVLEADGGAKGLELAFQEKPDAILMDMATPGMGAGETISALRDNPETASIPVVFLTTRTLSADLDKMGRMGAAGILLKPFDPMTLASQLQQIIKP